MTDVCIGITDAEMRVYAEYQEEMIDILDSIEEYENAKSKISLEGISGKSIINLTNDQKDYYTDHVLNDICKKEMYDQVIEGLKAMYEYRKQYCVRVEERLNLLDYKTRQFLYMRYFDKMTLEQIAEATFSNRQSVYERLNKILKFQLTN